MAAPMTSKAQTIASMITVVAEGRCTLMATYQIFQFIIAYALVQVGAGQPGRLATPANRRCYRAMRYTVYGFPPALRAWKWHLRLSCCAPLLRTPACVCTEHATCTAPDMLWYRRMRRPDFSISLQAFETNLMYTYALNLGNYQYLIQDLFFTTVLAALMGFTEPRCGERGRVMPVLCECPVRTTN